MKSICGIDCTGCGLRTACGGCRETAGRPFGGECVVAAYSRKGGSALDSLKKELVAAFNGLGIPDMEEVTGLNALKGSFVNLAYTLPSGETVKFWDDNKIYLGNQLSKTGSSRCYGIVADEKYLMVAEYGDGGDGAELVVFKRWN